MPTRTATRSEEFERVAVGEEIASRKISVDSWIICGLHWMEVELELELNVLQAELAVRFHNAMRCDANLGRRKEREWKG